MQRLRPYSKAIAAMVSAIVGVVAVHFSELDSALLEAAILMVLTAAGVYVAPANAPKEPPSGTDLRTPWWVVILLLPLLWLGGCVNQPYRAPQTVYESLLVGNAYGEEVTHTVNDLRRGQVISSAMHQEALDYLQKALDTSRTARAAYQAGNWLEAQAGLDRLESSLRMVALLIQPHLPDDPANQAFIIRYAGGNP